MNFVKQKFKNGLNQKIKDFAGFEKKCKVQKTNFSSKINLYKHKIRNVRTTWMSILARIFSNQINYFTF